MTTSAWGDFSWGAIPWGVMEYDYYRDRLSRTPVSLVVLTLDYCGNAFGAAPLRRHRDALLQHLPHLQGQRPLLPRHEGVQIHLRRRPPALQRGRAPLRACHQALGHGDQGQPDRQRPRPPSNLPTKRTGTSASIPTLMSGPASREHSGKSSWPAIRTTKAVPWKYTRAFSAWPRAIFSSGIT